MSFIGPVGNLMNETGLADIMSSAFGGVHITLSGKKFPMCMRALRMIVEVRIFDDPNVQCSDNLIAELEERALRSKTCKV